MSKKIQINKGDTFGRLTVIEELQCTNSRKFSLLCMCGEETQVFLSNLRTGHTKSCGCLSAEEARKSSTKHGKFGSKVYKSWQEMKNRCLNINSKAYPYYGGRGIKVQEDWIASFENFYACVGDPPENIKSASIDRIDVNGNYEEGNVRWADCKSQNRNRQMFTNNTSGHTGVSLRERKGKRRAIAFWMDLEGKEKSKSFSEEKYGGAYITLAKNYRAEVIEEMNKNGADYGKNHGL